MVGSLSIEAEEAYARRLIDVGERLMARARGRQGLVEGKAVEVAIEGSFEGIDDVGERCRLETTSQIRASCRWPGFRVLDAVWWGWCSSRCPSAAGR